MIKVDLRGIVVDLFVVAFFFLLAAGVAHRYNHSQGDHCGDPSSHAQAQSR